MSGWRDPGVRDELGQDRHGRDRAMLALLAVGLIGAGGALLWAFGTQRTADGFFTSPSAGSVPETTKG